MKNTPLNPAAPRRLNRRYTQALLASFAFVASLAFTARPAEAAGSVSACFQVKTGGLYYQNTYTQPGLMTYLLYSADKKNWYVGAYGFLDQKGCVSWVVQSHLRNYYLALHVYSKGYQGYVNATYSGWAPSWATPGTHHSNLGFAYLSCDLCPWG